MPHSAIAANFDKALDIHLNFTAKITFDGIILRDIITDSVFIIIRKITNTNIRIYACITQNFLGAGQTDPIYVG